MVVFLEVSTISNEELWCSVKVTIGFLVTTLSLGGSRCFPFKNDGGHCVHGDLQCWRHYLIPFPRSVPRHNPVSELLQFLVFALTCTVNCGTLYRHVCAFPNHVLSIEFTTGGLQSSCRNTRMINGNRSI
jgi:hypothetical protein